MVRKHERLNIFLVLFWITPAAYTILFAHLNVVKWLRPSRAFIYFLYSSRQIIVYAIKRPEHRTRNEIGFFFSTKKCLAHSFIVHQLIFVVWLFKSIVSFMVLLSSTIWLTADEKWDFFKTVGIYRPWIAACFNVMLVKIAILTRLLFKFNKCHFKKSSLKLCGFVVTDRKTYFCLLLLLLKGLYLARPWTFHVRKMRGISLWLIL